MSLYLFYYLVYQSICLAARIGYLDFIDVVVLDGQDGGLEAVYELGQLAQVGDVEEGEGDKYVF